ncbi:hypothetical protein SMSP2_01796 [Limihaloglobus sulfuriphilus]|uniref:Uncharacterized protein n=1 Tax=Limihaloglobus sulfuriphilus TaxID=1851148 RepID=A0A1Q2MGM0_9BACT|nr:hypothetical protein [Limihaloglobus sulfuriphilus]AQQ71422.1 hypothetical protein SMSP2_01796 [Limihaloglobus sulfuriphilus]
MGDLIKSTSIDSLMDQHAKQVFKTGDNAALKVVLNMAYDMGMLRGISSHPRYTEIEIQGMSGHYAILSRKPYSNMIDVEILTPEVEVKSSIPADDIAQRLVAAQHVYSELEDVKDNFYGLDSYIRPFEHITYFGGSKIGL